MNPTCISQEARQGTDTKPGLENVSLAQHVHAFWPYPAAGTVGHGGWMGAKPRLGSWDCCVTAACTRAYTCPTIYIYQAHSRVCVPFPGLMKAARPPVVLATAVSPCDVSCLVIIKSSHFVTL